jgi:hypothetical protein
LADSKRLGGEGVSEPFSRAGSGRAVQQKEEIMESEFEKTATRPLPDWRRMCDDDILNLLADQRGRSVAQMANHFHVTKTAIRNRLIRLMHVKAVMRTCEGQRRRSRPEYTYYLTGGGGK